MSAIQESLDSQKAHSIATRVDEVAADVAAEAQGKSHRLLQGCVFQCVSLAKQWRGAVEYYHESISTDFKDFDFRNLRDVLLPAAERTQAIYADVESLLRQSSIVVQDRSDLTLAVIEARNIVEWLESWPTNDPTFRNAAREEIARGEKSLTDDELVALMSQ